MAGSLASLLGHDSARQGRLDRRESGRRGQRICRAGGPSSRCRRGTEVRDLKNGARIYGPIVATLGGFGNAPSGKDLRKNEPRILNAANGKTGDGATLEFTRALGTRGELAHIAVSGVIGCRLRLVKPLRTPNIHVTFAG